MYVTIEPEGETVSLPLRDLLPSQHRELYVRVIARALAVAVLLALVGLLARQLDVGPGIVPLVDPDWRPFWLTGLVLTIATGVAFQVADRTPAHALETAIQRRVRYASASELPTAWILPAVTTLAAVMFLGVYHSGIAIAGCALGAFLLLTAGAITRHHLFDADADARERARGIATILVHVIAFVALSMIYINKVRSLFSATAVLVIGVLLLLVLTEGEDVLFGRRLVYALAGGLLLGEVTWALNYWKATGWIGGAVLLVFFYVVAGLIAAHVRAGVTRRDLAEYGGVGALAFGIIVYSLFR